MYYYAHLCMNMHILIHSSHYLCTTIYMHMHLHTGAPLQYKEQYKGLFPVPSPLLLTFTVFCAFTVALELQRWMALCGSVRASTPCYGCLPIYVPVRLLHSHTALPMPMPVLMRVCPYAPCKSPCYALQCLRSTGHRSTCSTHNSTSWNQPILVAFQKKTFSKSLSLFWFSDSHLHTYIKNK